MRLRRLDLSRAMIFAAGLMGLVLTVSLLFPAQGAFGGESIRKACPANVGWSKRALLGKRYVVAKRIAERQGCSIRARRINGKRLPGVVDTAYRPSRINVGIAGSARLHRNKKVVRILGFG